MKSGRKNNILLSIKYGLFCLIIFGFSVSSLVSKNALAGGPFGGLLPFDPITTYLGIAIIPGFKDIFCTLDPLESSLLDLCGSSGKTPCGCDPALDATFCAGTEYTNACGANHCHGSLNCCACDPAVQATYCIGTNYTSKTTLPDGMGGSTVSTFDCPGTKDCCPCDPVESAKYCEIVYYTNLCGGKCKGTHPLDHRSDVTCTWENCCQCVCDPAEDATHCSGSTYANACSNITNSPAGPLMCNGSKNPTYAPACAPINTGVVCDQTNCGQTITTATAACTSIPTNGCGLSTPLPISACPGCVDIIVNCPACAWKEVAP